MTTRANPQAGVRAMTAEDLDSLAILISKLSPDFARRVGDEELAFRTITRMRGLVDQLTLAVDLLERLVEARHG
jgi:hypothetical protein